MLSLGELSIQRVVELERLVVPKRYMYPDGLPEGVLEWAKPRYGPRFIDPDTDDFILCCHSYVIRTPKGRVIVVDTCNGNDKPRSVMTDVAGLKLPYLERLAEAGVRPEDVDLVLCTHLHPDHVGWNTRRSDGRWVPTFPNARYLMSATDHADFAALEGQELRGPRIDHRAAFADSVLPVIEAGQADLVDPGHRVELELDVGIRLEGAPGHTRGHLAIHLESRGRRAVAAGDVIHHPIQLNALDARALADRDAPQAAATRRALVASIVDTDTVLLPAHFGAPAFCRVVDAGERLDVAWLDA